MENREGFDWLLNQILINNVKVRVADDQDKSTPLKQLKMEIRIDKDVIKALTDTVKTFKDLGEFLSYVGENEDDQPCPICTFINEIEPEHTTLEILHDIIYDLGDLSENDTELLSVAFLFMMEEIELDDISQIVDVVTERYDDIPEYVETFSNTVYEVFSRLNKEVE